MKIRVIVSVLIILSFCFTMSYCTRTKSNPQLIEDLASIQTTENGWFVTLSGTPINSISINNEHVFGSTDYGLLHFFSLTNDPTGELLFPTTKERCLNHFVGSGTDENGTPISRYLYIENASLHSRDLFCSANEKKVVPKNGPSISLSTYPLFAGGTIKHHLDSDVSSKTTALAAYTDLLFISKDQTIQHHSLENHVFQSHLIGSSYYYLSRGMNPPATQFHSLKTSAPSKSWSFHPSSNNPTEALIDASFSHSLQRFFACFRYESIDTRTLLIQSLDSDGTKQQEKILTGNAEGPLPTSSMYSFVLNKKILLIGELFQKGEIICMDTTNFQEVWRYTDESENSILDIVTDPTHQKLFVLLTNGRLVTLDIENGNLMQSDTIGPDLEDVSYSTGSIHMFGSGITGCLNNSIANPYRSLFFYQSLSSQ
jgi:hypothetical protein